MKITFKRSLAILMSIVMCVSMFFGIGVTANAATSYIYNWGERGTVATELSDEAIAFYNENGVSLSTLLALDGSSTESGVPSSALYSELQSLMTENHTTVTSYDDTRDLFMYTDCENGGGTISSFYSGAAIGPEWDSGSTWNREHTWPNSKGDAAGNGENDIMMLRPAATSENSSRGNKAYGESSDYYNPNSVSGGTYDLRGDCARIILYQYVRWQCTNTGSDYNPSGIFGTDGVIESQEMLLDWIAEDPVDTWELGRNDSVESITGTRNVFVDYPELAFDLFNESVPADYQSPSGGVSTESATTKATITFDDTAKRTTFTTSQQVWEENGVTFTNNKASSSSSVGDYSDPIRIYKNSEVVIEYANPITKLEFNVNSSSSNYTTYLNTALTDSALGDVTVSGNVVTIVLTTPSTSFTFTNTGGATRFDSITLYASTDTGESGGTTPDTEEPEDTGSTEQTEETTATITFDANKTQRVSYSTLKQVWSNDDLTFTNDKASSTTNVADYSNPVRVYANSSITLAHATGKLKTIQFTAGSSSYATALNNSIGTVDGATVTVSGSTVTVTFDSAVESFTIASLTTQVRLNSITTTVLVPVSSDSVTITAVSNNDAYGTVEVSGSYIIATPNTGYEVSGYQIISGTPTVTQNGNNFLVVTDADTTIQINFIARTLYTVSFSEQGSVTSTLNAYSGDKITLPQITSDEYTVVGWVAAVIDGETTTKPTVYEPDDEYTVTENTTLYALYSRTEAGGSGESNVFAKHTGELTAGDYLIAYNGKAMKAAVSSNRFSYAEVGTADSIDNTDETIIWTLAQNGDYWTLYNESTSSYAAGTGSNNKGKLLTSITDYALWTASGSGTYEFVNKGNAANSVNANLRNNGTYGFACYSTSTGGALTLYKRTETSLTTYYFTGVTEAEYSLTAVSNNESFGTVTVSGTTIYTTAAEGYFASSYEVTSGDASVVQEGTTFFVTLNSDATVQIIFEPLPTYTVTFAEGETTLSTESTYSGGQITLPEYSGTLDEYTTFDGWAEAEGETDAAKIYSAGSTYYVTANVTLYAQFTVTTPPQTEESDHYFVKVTEALDDYSGTYLIVYEEGGVAFNGGLDNLKATNGLNVTISDSKIGVSDETLAASFTIEAVEGGYTIKSTSGYYIGRTSSNTQSNDLLYNASTQYINSVSLGSDGADIVSGQTYLRWNNSSEFFRYYKSETYTAQKPIALYKLDVGEISGAQVTLASDLSVNYFADISNIESADAADFEMRFTIGTDTVITVSAVKEGSQFVFAFPGIAPQRMGDIISAELIYKETVIDKKDDYSIRQNVINLISANPDNEELKQFVSDMLYYGAAAQNYTGYNKNNLVTAGLEDVINEPYAKEPSESYDELTLTTPSGDVKFKSATVWFDAVNKLIVKINGSSSDVKVYVTPSGGTRTELSYNSTVGGYMTDDIKVVDFGTIYTFELCDAEDNVLQTLTYNVNSYAYSRFTKSEDDDMINLACALFRLGQSALEAVGTL